MKFTGMKRDIRGRRSESATDISMKIRIRFEFMLRVSYGIGA
jgi:hypothetical protein